MLKKLYEPIMAFLALAVVTLMIVEFSYKLEDGTIKLFGIIDTVVLIIFAVDYFIRLYLAEKKWKFIKENLFDLIAIIPFDSVFRLARLSRLIRLTKLFKILKFSVYLLRTAKKFDRFFKTNNFHYVLLATIGVILAGSVLICITEGMSFTNALWWAFVTATTVGYGDISPKTGIGRIIAVVLMISGISTIGMLTGTIFTYFIGMTKHKTTYKGELLENIKTKLDDFDNLTNEDIEAIKNLLTALKSSKTVQEKDSENKVADISV